MLPHFNKLLVVDDKAVLSDVLWTLSYLTDSDKFCIKKIAAAINLKKVVETMMDNEVGIRAPAIKVVGNICSATQAEVQEIIESGGLVPLQLILANSSLAMHHREVCWALSNIAAGPNEHVKNLLECNLISALASVAQSSPDPGTRKEADWAIANACSEISEYLCVRMVEAGVLPALIGAVAVPDTALQEITIAAIERVMYCGLSMDEDNQIARMFEDLGGLRELENVHFKLPATLHEKVTEIIDTYFADREPGNVVSMAMGDVGSEQPMGKMVPEDGVEPNSDRAGFENSSCNN